MKKLLAILLALSLLMVCVPAMAEVDGAFKVPEGGYDGSEVTIVFANTMGTNLAPVLEEAIAAFEALYPNIHVEYDNSSTNYDVVRDNIITQAQAGNEPNMAYAYPDHVARYNTGYYVAPLDNLIDSQIEVTRADGTTEILGLTQEQKDDFIQGFYREGAVFGDGLMYSLPMQKSTELLYYNKTFFDENGIEVPTTWDELEAVCAKIKEIDPNSIPLGYDSSSNWFITMCEQYGSPYTSATGDHFLFDNEQNHAFIKKFVEWYGLGYVTTQQLYGAFTSGLFTSTDTTKSYMSIGSSAGATYQRPAANSDGSYPFEVGIATIPQVDPSNPKVISQGPNVCIFNKSNPQEVVASWLFLKYLTTDTTFQATFSNVSGYMPVIKSVYNNEAYAAFLASADGGNGIAALSVKKSLEQEAAYYTSPAFEGSTDARDQVGALINKCLVDANVEGADVDAVIADAFEEAVEECEYANP